jgi:transcription antitermination factor NusG
VAHVRSRHEKVVRQGLEQRGIEHLLPVYRSMRQWKDRRKQIEAALFPGYVFVHFALSRRAEVLKIPGVIQFVSCAAQPVSIPQHEIAPLQQGSRFGTNILPHPFLCAGQRVRVRSGPLAGVEGFILRRKDRVRLVISIAMIMRSASLEVDESDVAPI